MAHPLKELRKGDVIAILATVTDRKVGDSIIVKSVSQNDIVIHRDADVEKVVKFDIQKGDRVQWHEGGPCFGTIISIDEDGNNVWAWIKEDCKWPRRTINVKDLKRVPS